MCFKICHVFLLLPPKSGLIHVTPSSSKKWTDPRYLSSKQNADSIRNQGQGAICECKLHCENFFENSVFMIGIKIMENYDESRPPFGF